MNPATTLLPFMTLHSYSAPEHGSALVMVVSMCLGFAVFGGCFFAYYHKKMREVGLNWLLYCGVFMVGVQGALMFSIIASCWQGVAG